MERYISYVARVRALKNIYRKEVKLGLELAQCAHFVAADGVRGMGESATIKRIKLKAIIREVRQTTADAFGHAINTHQVFGTHNPTKEIARR